MEFVHVLSSDSIERHGVESNVGFTGPGAKKLFIETSFFEQVIDIFFIQFTVLVLDADLFHYLLQLQPLSIFSQLLL